MYCKNCGREIKDDYNFCPYCKTELNESNNQKNDSSFFGKVLYKGYNGKDVTLGKFIIGLFLILFGTYIAFKVAGG